MNNQKITPHALHDSEALGIECMDQDSVRHHHISLQELKETCEVEVINGKPTHSGDITYIGNIGIEVQDYKEQLPMYVTRLGHHLIVLRILFLWLHDGGVYFGSHTITF